MEPELVDFFKRVAFSIFVAFCWLVVNVTIGIRFDAAFIEDHVTVGNVIYYIWLVGSLIAMLLFFLHLWRQVPKF